jgi:hypothetical protein
MSWLPVYQNSDLPDLWEAHEIDFRDVLGTFILNKTFQGLNPDFKPKRPLKIRSLDGKNVEESIYDLSFCLRALLWPQSGIFGLSVKIRLLVFHCFTSEQM